MPVCPSCGKNFSGFSFGANPAAECSECRRARAQAPTANLGASGAAGPPIPRVAVRRLPWPAVTLGIIAANVLVYVAMGLSGASWSEPSILDSVKWGADFGPLTLSSDWWRLFTSTFVHFGIVHIALNMWCLWNLGSSLEPFMGRKVFGVMYVASGLAASLVSVAWNPWKVSAGASGAIFGVAGALVSYFALKKTPLDRALVNRNLTSLGIFIFYNLLYGMRGTVDNAAHIGGLVAGLILGAAIPPMLRVAAGPADAVRVEDNSRANRVAATVAIVSVAILASGFSALRDKRSTMVQYGAAVKLLQANKPEPAAAKLQDALKLDPGFFPAQGMLGQMLLEHQNFAAAVDLLHRASSADPEDYIIQHNLGLADLEQGSLNDAVWLTTESLQAQKGNTWRTLFVRAIAEAEKAEYPDAKSDLENVIKQNPDLAEAKQLLAQIPDSGSPATKLPIAIPYDKLVMKSDYWPLFP
jgi:membrane associated rhomboid family serine protease